MTTLDLFSLRFALACCACLAAGLGVWGSTALCRRLLPVLALQRSTWLLGQLVIMATCVLAAMPQTGRLRMVPAIELADAAPIEQPAATPPARTAALQPVAPAEEGAPVAALYAARTWLLVYLSGLAFAVCKLAQAQCAVRRLAASGVRVTPPGFTGNAAPLPVLEVAAPISPMLVGPFAPRLLLPQHLRSFDPEQQTLIVEHELTHWRRGDLHWMTASLVLQTLFWFHPVMRLLRARLSWAQELACDQDVLRGRTPRQRKAYAAALVAQLTLQHRPMHMALAFGGVSHDTLAARIALIRTPLTAGSAWPRGIAGVAVAAVFIGNLALQPALAWHGASQAGIDCTEIVDGASGAPLLREGECDARITPASTFNIAVSLMGFDNGFLRDAHTPRLPFHEGYADWNDSWRAATDPAAFITNSTVWYAQQVTTHLGAGPLARYLAAFNYGNQDLSGEPGKHNGLTHSWIGSSLRISPDEQVVLLRRLLNRQLPVSAHARDMTAQLLKLPFETGGWQVYGKTGTASPLLPDGTQDGAHAYGWFVGWASKGNRTVVFARLLCDRTRADSFAGPRVKAAFLRDLPARLAAL